jgi:hypothetical protein
MAVLRGNAVDLLKLLYDTLRNKPIIIKYNYSSYNRYLNADEIIYLSKTDKYVFKILSLSLMHSGKMLIKVLVKLGFKPPRSYILLHSRAYSAWASYIIYTLNSLGYTYIPLSEVLK